MSDDKRTELEIGTPLNVAAWEFFEYGLIQPEEENDVRSFTHWLALPAPPEVA